MYRNTINPMAPDNTIGRVSAMDGINNKSVNEVALHEAQQGYKKLNLGLDKMDDPNFGCTAVAESLYRNYA